MPVKVCPRCHKKDITDFSTCRFCSFKYDAVPPKANGGGGFKFGFWPVMICLFIAIRVFQTPLINAVGFVATGGKEKDVTTDSLINFAAATSGQDAKQLKSDVWDMQTAVTSDKPLDEAFVRRMAEADHKSIEEARQEILRFRAEYRHKHHFD